MYPNAHHVEIFASAKQTKQIERVWIQDQQAAEFAKKFLQRAKRSKIE
jgi:hypothetical protein